MAPDHSYAKVGIMATINGNKFYMRETLKKPNGETVTVYTVGDIVQIGDTTTFKKSSDVAVKTKSEAERYIGL